MDTSYNFNQSPMTKTTEGNIYYFQEINGLNKVNIVAETLQKAEEDLIEQRYSKDDYRLIDIDTFPCEEGDPD